MAVRFLRKLAENVRVPVGLAFNVLGAIDLLFNVSPLLGLPSNVVAGGFVLLGTGALGWALWDQHSALDDRAQRAAGLQEFHNRLFEGTEVLRAILPWPRFPPELGRGEISSETLKRTEAYAKLVDDWNQACLATVQNHLSHRKWLLDRPVDYAPAIQSKIPLRVIRLREEVREKIDRMNTLQLELEAQSRRAAIS